MDWYLVFSLGCWAFGFLVGMLATAAHIDASNRRKLRSEDERRSLRETMRHEFMIQLAAHEAKMHSADKTV